MFQAHAGEPGKRQQADARDRRPWRREGNHPSHRPAAELRCHPAAPDTIPSSRIANIRGKVSDRLTGVENGRVRQGYREGKLHGFPEHADTVVDGLDSVERIPLSMVWTRGFSGRDISVFQGQASFRFNKSRVPVSARRYLARFGIRLPEMKRRYGSFDVYPQHCPTFFST